jgi:hypothetical protein
MIEGWKRLFDLKTLSTLHYMVYFNNATFIKDRGWEVGWIYMGISRRHTPETKSDRSGKTKQHLCKYWVWHIIWDHLSINFYHSVSQLHSS